MGRVCSRYLRFRCLGFSLFPVRWFVEVSGRMNLLAEVLTHNSHSTTASHPASAALDALPLPRSLSPGKKGRNALVTADLPPENSGAGALAR